MLLHGPDVNTNCGPANFACGEFKTHTQDLPRIRKAKRQQARHEGAKKRREDPGRRVVRLEGSAVHPNLKLAGAWHANSRDVALLLA